MTNGLRETQPPASKVGQVAKEGSGKEQPLTNGVKEAHQPVMSTARGVVSNHKSPAGGVAKGAQSPATGSSVMNETPSSSSGTSQGNYMIVERRCVVMVTSNWDGYGCLLLVSIGRVYNWSQEGARPPLTGLYIGRVCNWSQGGARPPLTGLCREGL